MYSSMWYFLLVYITSIGHMAQGDLFAPCFPVMNVRIGSGFGQFMETHKNITLKLISP